MYESNLGGSPDYLGRPDVPERIRVLPAGHANWAKPNAYDEVRQEWVIGDQDRYFINDAARAYGAYDGVGQYPSSGRAAEIASRVMNAKLTEFMQTKSTHTLAEAEQALRQGYAAIRDILENEGIEKVGMTAALSTIIIDTHEGPYLCGLAAGDVQGTLLRDNTLHHMTTDRGQVIIKKVQNKYGNTVDKEYIANWLGPGSDGSRDNFFAQKLFVGDKIAIGSDGIFGNTDSKMPDDVLKVGLNSPTPMTSAKRLLDLSHSVKYDDKVVTVVFIEGKTQQSIPIPPGIDDVRVAAVMAGTDSALYPILPERNRATPTKRVPRPSTDDARHKVGRTIFDVLHGHPKVIKTLAIAFAGVAALTAIAAGVRSCTQAISNRPTAESSTNPKEYSGLKGIQYDEKGRPFITATAWGDKDSNYSTYTDISREIFQTVTHENPSASEIICVTKLFAVSEADAKKLQQGNKVFLPTSTAVKQCVTK